MLGLLKKIAIQLSTFISPLLGKLHSPWAHKAISALDYREVIEHNFPPGTVFLTRTMGEFTNLFIGGYWKHAAIYRGNDHRTVVEATGHGVVESDLIDFLLKKDYVAAFIPLFASEEKMNQACDFAISQIGKPYDYEFATSDIKGFYCAELIFTAYNQVLDDSPFVLKARLGQMTIIPNDIAEAKEKWYMVWGSNSLKTA